MKRLAVWLGGQRVATLVAKRPWEIACQYEKSLVSSPLLNRPYLSCSLPVTRSKAPASPWVRGLLPEGEHLLALASRAQVPTNYFAHLLDRYGRDIAGAFAIANHAPSDEAWNAIPYTASSLAAEVESVVDAPGFAVRDDSELSIAGLQNKLLVCSLGPNKWGRPVHGQPSTHIFKVGDGRFAGLLRAEHECMKLAQRFGLTTVKTAFRSIAGHPVLIVERYDRVHDKATGDVRRLHQEDACQALSVNIDQPQGRGKYEEFGGPSFAHIAQLLDRFGDPMSQHPLLLRVALFTWVIGNADAHGKNISFMIDLESGSIRLAPLYDTVPTAIWPKLRSTAAMSVNGKFAKLRFRDFVQEARLWGMSEVNAASLLSEAIGSLRRVISTCSYESVRELAGARLDRIDASR